MLVVIPVSESDEKLLEAFLNCLHYFGPYESHDVLIVCRPSDARYGVKAYNGVKTLFRCADIHVFDEDGVRGWPQGPNYYWRQTIIHLKEDRKNNSPWLWMELDMTPLKQKWIDILEEDYKLRKQPCYGWVQNTTTITTEGVVVPIGKHLVGAAIYPPDLENYCKVWYHVDKINTAFDVLCQWELVPITYHSRLFQHCFRTQNYKELGSGCFKGEDNNNFPDNLRFDELVRSDTVLHHGCDDGTLAELILRTGDHKSMSHSSAPVELLLED